jgi:hypothetical protein
VASLLPVLADALKNGRTLPSLVAERALNFRLTELALWAGATVTGSKPGGWPTSSLSDEIEHRGSLPVGLLDEGFADRL